MGMNRFLGAAALIAVAAPALSRGEPARIKTERIVPTVQKPMYQIDDDGAVSIDWTRVEEASKSASQSGNIARVMQAVRNGSWKPMK
jgi:hypothetical protein